MTKSELKFSIGAPFKISDDIEPNKFNVLSDYGDGVSYFLYFTTPTKDTLRVDLKSKVILSNECSQYYVYSGRSIVGSFFESRTSKTSAHPYKIFIGSKRNIGEFSCVTSTIDKGGIFVYKDTRSNLLLVTVDISFSPFAVVDK